jgi:ribosomal protein L37AE/L43A
MLPDKIETVRMLSQDHGWFDWEIAKELNVHRVTVTRWRDKYNIPRPQLENREDKKQVCKRCGRTDYIKRKKRVRYYCQPCQSKAYAELFEKKRAYMKAYDKKKKHSEGMLQNP